MGLKSLLLFTAVLGSSLAHPTSHGNLRGEDASRTLELSNFTEYLDQYYVRILYIFWGMGFLIFL